LAALAERPVEHKPAVSEYFRDLRLHVLGLYRNRLCSLAVGATLLIGLSRRVVCDYGVLAQLEGESFLRVLMCCLTWRGRGGARWGGGWARNVLFGRFRILV